MRVGAAGGAGGGAGQRRSDGSRGAVRM